MGDVRGSLLEGRGTYLPANMDSYFRMHYSMTREYGPQPAGRINSSTTINIKIFLFFNDFTYANNRLFSFDV